MNIEANVALSFIKSPVRTTENLPMTPRLDEDEDLKHIFMDKLHAINKCETVHQMTIFSTQEIFNIFMVVKNALLKTFLRERVQTHRIAPADMLFILPITLKSVKLRQLCSKPFRVSIRTIRRLL